jgi:mannose/fructose/N-acetylgalactosamine-specific phosphotransferase system component IIC
MPMFDTHIIFAIVGVALVGGFIGLDQTAVGQFMISQPIVAGPLTGWMLGDPIAGIVIGAVLELLWVLDMPVGSFVPADATISAVSATAIAALGSTGGAPLPVIGFSILLTTAMAPVTMKANGIVRHWNSRLADSVVTSPGPDAGRALAVAHLSGLPVFFMKSFILYLVFLPVGIVAVFVFRHLPENVHRAMSLFVKLLPLLGVALVVRKLSVKTVDIFFLSGFMIAAVAGLIFHAPAVIIILLTVTGGWVGARYSERRS